MMPADWRVPATPTGATPPRSAALLLLLPPAHPAPARSPAHPRVQYTSVPSAQTPHPRRVVPQTGGRDHRRPAARLRRAASRRPGQRLRRGQGGVALVTVERLE